MSDDRALGEDVDRTTGHAADGAAGGVGDPGQEEISRLRAKLEVAERETDRTLFRATRLARVVKVLGDHSELAELSERAVCEMAELFSADLALLLLGPDDALRIEAHWGVRPRDVPTTTVQLPSTHRAAINPVLVGAADEIGYPPWLASYSPRHIAYARLLTRGQTLGYIMLGRREAAPFELSDAHELQALATRIALAVDNGLLYRRMHDQIQRLDRLYRVTTELAGILHLELDGVASAVARMLRDEVGVPAVAVYVPDGEVLRLSGRVGPVTDLPERVSRDELVVTELPGELLLLRTGDLDSGAVVVSEPPREGTDERALLLHMVELAGLVIDKALLYDLTRRQAEQDALTGLPNRLLLTRRMEGAVARALRRGSNVAVIFLDVDRFKVINDSLGHAAGDELLAEVAARLLAVTRSGDTVGRLGGDEFVVVCEDVEEPEHAVATAARLQAAVTDPAIDVSGARISVTLSQGIALTGRSGYSAEALLRDADTAMYRAKELGRNRIEVFDDEFRTRAVARLQGERALRDALEHGRLRVLYQPIVRLTDRVMVAVEALMRFEDVDGRIVPPAEFIDVAEDSGLIVPMGEWILREASRQSARWRGQLRRARPFAVSVNLSVRQLAQGGFAELVAEVLTETGADPHDLRLEITESVLMHTGLRTVETLRAVKEMGIRLGIDDFGTGHSSLTYLKRLPIDFLKIDRSFVDGLDGDPEDAAIVAAIIGLARALGLRTVAEGVEREAQIARLLELGCDHAQGYYFARPMSAAAVSDLLDHPTGGLGAWRVLESGVVAVGRAGA